MDVYVDFFCLFFKCRAGFVDRYSGYVSIYVMRVDVYVQNLLMPAV